MTTTEKNILIAEFFGHQRTKPSVELAGGRFKHWYIEGLGWFDDDELKYHSDYAWIMPLTDEIEKQFKYFFHIQTWQPNTHYCNIVKKSQRVVEQFGATKQEAVCNAVVDFILLMQKNETIVEYIMENK